MHEPQNVTTHVGLTLVKPATTLEDLATQIRESYGQAMAAMRTSVTEARSCGKLLLHAKAQVPHGEWIGWVHTNTGISARTAQKWMRIAEFNVLGPDEYGIAKALDMIATPKVATPGTLLAKAPRKTHLPVPAEVIDPADPTPRQRSVARKQRDGISRAVWALDDAQIFTRHQAPTVDVGRLIAVTDRETRQEWVKAARNSRAELTRMIQWLEEFASYDDALTDGSGRRWPITVSRLMSPTALLATSDLALTPNNGMRSRRRH